jgi:hypothetical protein
MNVIVIISIDTRLGLPILSLDTLCVILRRYICSSISQHLLLQETLHPIGVRKASRFDKHPILVFVDTYNNKPTTNNNLTLNDHKVHNNLHNHVYLLHKYIYKKSNSVKRAVAVQSKPKAKGSLAQTSKH